MAEHFTEIQGPARRATLGELLRCVREAAQGAALPEALGLRLELAVEELFSNTLEHGFAGESDSPVSVRLSREGDFIRLDYCDRAPPFDPTRAPPRADTDEDLGGFGLEVIRTMADGMAYHHTDGQNCTTFLYRP